MAAKKLAGPKLKLPKDLLDLRYGFLLMDCGLFNLAWAMEAEGVGGLNQAAIFGLQDQLRDQVLVPLTAVIESNSQGKLVKDASGKATGAVLVPVRANRGLEAVFEFAAPKAAAAVAASIKSVLAALTPLTEAAKAKGTLVGAQARLAYGCVRLAQGLEVLGVDVWGKEAGWAGPVYTDYTALTYGFDRAAGLEFAKAMHKETVLGKGVLFQGDPSVQPRYRVDPEIPTCLAAIQTALENSVPGLKGGLVPGTTEPVAVSLHSAVVDTFTLLGLLGSYILPGYAEEGIQRYAKPMPYGKLFVRGRIAWRTSEHVWRKYVEIHRLLWLLHEETPALRALPDPFVKGGGLTPHNMLDFEHSLDGFSGHGLPLGRR